jgi:hypothetical protein
MGITVIDDVDEVELGSSTFEVLGQDQVPVNDTVGIECGLPPAQQGKPLEAATEMRFKVD